MATNNAVNTSLAGQTGTGNFVGNTSPTIITPASLGVQQQDLNMNTHKITGVDTPTNPNDAVNKTYADAIASGITTILSCYSSTTADLNATQAGAGVGATLTNAGAMAAFLRDGVSPPLNSRILVKDQILPQHNGIYILNPVGSGAVNWILTRATDYDQAPGEIKPGTLIAVNNGTLNANTSWLETATVVTVDTDPILFSQFTFSSSSFLMKSQNLNDVADKIISFNTISPSNAKGDLIVNDGTNDIALAVGVTNGQILQVASGAASGLSYSTATYPATTTVNQILYSSSANVIAGITTVNGGVLVTNNLGVPSMLANPAAAGRILQSANAAIPAWSIPTYPSISGTARKVIISDGTNNVYSTETYAVPGAVGNVMTSDGTNWTSAAPAASSENPFITNARLTLTSGVPVTTSDVTAATSVYLTPYKGNQISVFDGASTWTTLTFTELTIAVPASTNTIYDVFVYDNAGTLTVDTLVAWSSDTARATPIIFQDGVYVKSGDTTRKWIGSFRTTAVNGQTEDSVLKRYLYNYYNRCIRSGARKETTATWNYSLAAYRQTNNSTANQLDFLVGVLEDSIYITCGSLVNNSTTTARSVTSGIGVSSTTVNSATIFDNSVIINVTYNHIKSIYNRPPPTEGRYFYAWLERGAGADTQIWYGSSTNGITGYMLG